MDRLTASYRAVGPTTPPPRVLAAVLETNPANARAIARRHVAPYLSMPNCTNDLRRLGFTDDDLAAGGSDRLVDALFAWGDIARIARRVRDHHDAGADHVCIQVFDANPYGLPMRQWKELAAALLRIRRDQSGHDESSTCEEFLYGFSSRSCETPPDEHGSPSRRPDACSWPLFPGRVQLAAA